MAVEDKYVNADLAAGDKLDQSYGNGICKTRIETEEIAAADDDGSVYRFFRVSENEVPVKLAIFNDAITSATDYDIGLYKVGVSGAAVDADILADGVDISSGNALATSNNKGLTTLDIANLGKTFGEILDAVGGAGTNTDSEYDLVVTANTVGSAAGSVTLVLESK